MTIVTPVSAESLRDVITPVDQEVLKGDFQQTKVLQEVGAELKSSGSFRFSKDFGLRWSTEEPIQSQLNVTPTGVKHLRKGEVVKEVAVSESPVVGALSRALYAVFSADESILKKQFETKPVARESGWEVDLEPRGQKMAQIISGITIRGAKFLEWVRVRSPDGNMTRIRLENIRIERQ